MLRIARAFATASGLKIQDIVVVGGGPVGLSAVAALRSNMKTSHLTCTLVEATSLKLVREYHKNTPMEYVNRNVSLSPESVQFMKSKVGNWRYIKHDRTKSFVSMCAYDSNNGDIRTLVDFSRTDAGYLALNIEIINIQSLLMAEIDSWSLTENPPVVMDNARVESIERPASGALRDWPIVSLSNGEKIQARLIIGADGYNSPVRRYANIQSHATLYDRFGIVGYVQMENDGLDEVAWQRFLTTGTLGLLPLTNGITAFVWALPPTLAELVMRVDDDIMPHLITAGSVLDEPDLNKIYGQLHKNPADMSVIDVINQCLSRKSAQELAEKFPLPAILFQRNSRGMFPLRMAHADTYIAPRVALVGDAAHTVHPLAGQGLNMGVMDVEALIRSIERGVEQGMDIGSIRVLDSYVKERWAQNKSIANVCDRIHKIFSTEFYPTIIARGLGMKAYNVVSGAMLRF